MKLYLAAAVIWIATVTATSESDSHGNWSNEKAPSEQNHERSKSQVKEELKKTNAEEHYLSSGTQYDGLFNSSQTKEHDEEREEDLSVKFASRIDNNYAKNESQTDSQQKFFKQIVQPYLLPSEVKPIQENTPNESTNGIARLARKSQNTSNDIVSVEYLPLQETVIQNQSTVSKYSVHENNSNDLGYAVFEDQVDIENVGDYGQRVRFLPIFRQKVDNIGRIRSRQSLDSLPSLEDYRKQYRKNSRPSTTKKPNISENTLNVPSEDRLSLSASKIDMQKALKQKETDEEYSKLDYLQNNKVKSTSLSWTSDGEVSQANNRENKPKKYASEQEITVTNVDNSKSTNTSALTVSLGKFSGPIVVPDLPRQKKYSFTTISNHSANDEISKPTPVSVESTTKSKGSDSDYLAASPAILNPLQVGVALVNAGQDMNLINDTATLSKDYLQNEGHPSNVSTLDNGSVIQNDAPDPGNSNFQNDQISQQEQISEVVATNLPTQSVEIQKSVEIFHTAPIQEIHYPVEFVPHVQQPPIKHRLPQKNQLKDRRVSQVNVYKSNEIVEETVPSNSQERGRYEYNVNENDVVYSSTNSQIDQIPSVARPLDIKPILGAREQLDNTQYDQIVAKYSKVQGNSDDLKEVVKQSDFDLVKGPSAVVTQSSRVAEALSGLLNLESPQGSQEVPQILLKPTSEPQAELRLLMTVPQSYPMEKVIEKMVQIPHTLDVVEKKVPFPVEKVIEKQITIPQPFPVHVPVDRVIEKQIRIPYPVHVEKVVEKKVPFAIQRFIIHQFPIHFRVPQPVSIPVEKSVPVEQVVEKTVHAPRPYPLDATKLIKSAVIPIYNAQNDGNFQQIRQQNFQSSGSSYGSVGDDQNYFNSTHFYGLGYTTLNRPLIRQPAVHALPKKFGSYGVQYPHSMTAYSALVNNNGNSALYGRTSVEDKIKDEYVGPVPRKVLQSSIGLQSKSPQYASPDIQSTMRRTRQEGVGNTGNFRQSKMEYGFKPPMVPSVQYDEQTASKVE